MASSKHLLVLTSVLTSVVTFAITGCASAPPEESDEELGEGSAAIVRRCAAPDNPGPCAGRPIQEAVRCATRQGARLLSFYRSPREQECVRRQNGCRNRCSGSQGCRPIAASCEGSPHTTCGSVDFIADGAPLTRAQLRACGFAKVRAPHANHWDYVGGGTTSSTPRGSDDAENTQSTESNESPAVTCASATLRQSVAPGTCVRRNDGSWYVCDANDPGAWPSIADAGDPRCTSCPQLSGGCGGGATEGTETGGKPGNDDDENE